MYICIVPPPPYLPFPLVFPVSGTRLVMGIWWEGGLGEMGFFLLNAPTSKRQKHIGIVFCIFVKLNNRTSQQSNTPTRQVPVGFRV